MKPPNTLELVVHPQDETRDALHARLLSARLALESSRDAVQRAGNQAERNHLLREIDLLSHLVLLRPSL